jgi:hypothetical protein
LSMLICGARILLYLQDEALYTTPEQPRIMIRTRPREGAQVQPCTLSGKQMWWVGDP